MVWETRRHAPLARVAGDRHPGCDPPLRAFAPAG